MNLFLVKEIRSKDGELHFKRWRLISTPWFSIYIHGIYKEDEDLHLHDHPWNYTSLILRGYFTERSMSYDVIKSDDSEWRNKRVSERVIGPFRLINRKAEQFHKILKLHSKAVYTLFFVGKRKREWGYDVNGKWIDHETYRKLKNENKLN